MKSVKLSLITLVMAGVALAGCVQEDPADVQSTTDEPSDVADFSDETGGIQGSVINEELFPVASAIVALLETEQSTTTTEAGTFALSNVQPGTYTIVAQALGFESKGQRVTVTAGTVELVEFVLAAVPSDDPYHETDTRKAALSGYMYKATPQCMYDLAGNGNTLLKTCGGIRTGCDPSPNCEVHYDDDLVPEWKTIFGEATWEAQTGVTGKGFSFDITAPNVTRGTGGSIDQSNPYTFFEMKPSPPIIWRIENPTTLDERGIAPEDRCCDWFYRIFPGYCDLGSVINNCQATPDYGVAQDNVITVYFSWFVREPAPPEWTALPDA